MMEQLIKQQSQNLNYQIIRQLPFLQPFFQTHPDISQFQNLSTNYLYLQSPHSNIVEDSTSYETHQEETKAKVTKNKTIKKERFLQDTSLDQSEFLIIKTNSSENRKKGTKPNSYPTKNFLQNFKTPHFNFLESTLGIDFVKSFEAVKNIKEKVGISLKDYETLYRILEFEDTFKKFFAKKILFRQMMTSRSIQSVKKTHQRKLHVFEKAFLRKRFDKIN